MKNKKMVLFFFLVMLITILTTAYLVFYLLAQKTIENPFIKISGTIQPDDELVYMTSDYKNFTHTFWRVGKNNKVVMPFYEHKSASWSSSNLVISPDNKKLAWIELDLTQPFISVLNTETKNVYTHPILDSIADRNSPAFPDFIKNLIWVSDNMLALTSYVVSHDKYFVSHFDYNGSSFSNVPDFYSTCPIPKDKIVSSTTENTITYFTDEINPQLINCNLLTGNTNTLFTTTNEKSIKNWFIENDRLLIENVAVKEIGDYQKENYGYLLVNLTTNLTQEFIIESNLGVVNFDSNYNLYYKSSANCLNFYSIKTKLSENIICDSENNEFDFLADQTYVSQENMLYFTQSDYLNNTISLYKYSIDNKKVTSVKTLIDHPLNLPNN